MARIDSLNILLDGGDKDLLAEEYGKVINNLEKKTISGLLKNKELSGDPTTGTVEAKRFANAQAKAYGTARAASKADALKAKPVTVKIDTDKEIIEEIEEKDVKLYGVEDVIKRRIKNHEGSMKRDLERAFFEKAKAAGSVTTAKSPNAAEAFEEIIQKIETTKTEYVDGVDREFINIVATPATYGKIRTYLDTLNNANVDTSVGEFGMFHGVKVFSSVYLPSGVDFIAMADGAVAQPVLPTVSNPEKINLSNAVGFGIFYSYGTENVMPELIAPAKLGVAPAKA